MKRIVIGGDPQAGDIAEIEIYGKRIGVRVEEVEHFLAGSGQVFRSAIKRIGKVLKFRKMKTGVELIAKERQRQIKQEGHTLKSDQDTNRSQELAAAAACYAMPPKDRKDACLFPADHNGMPKLWPWGSKWWKPTSENRIKELVKAGALIAAEIDRLNAVQFNNDKL